MYLFNEESIILILSIETIDKQTEICTHKYLYMDIDGILCLDATESQQERQ